MIASASAFAKEYHKGFFEDFNREFMVILAISMVAHFVGIIILLSLPLDFFLFPGWRHAQKGPADLSWQGKNGE